MIKPAHELETLSEDILNEIERIRMNLELELKNTTKNPENEQLFDELELPDNFLSERLRKDIRDGIQSKRTNNIYGDIKALGFRANLKTILREIYAYFLKFRYIDLSSIRQSNNEGGMNHTYRVWDLPDGCDSFWQDVPHRSSGNETLIMRMLPQRVTSIPWLGKLEVNMILRSLWWLLEMGLLEFEYDDRVIEDNQRQRIPVLRLNRLLQFEDQTLNNKLIEQFNLIDQMEVKRESIFSSLGVGVCGVGAYYTYKLVDQASSNDVVKIATYHLRTVVASKQISEWLKEKSTLKIKILCLGPKSSTTLSESADHDSLVSSLMLGIQQYKNLKSELPEGSKKTLAFEFMEMLKKIPTLEEQFYVEQILW